MPYVEIGASRLYYECHGEGPAIVLLHGVGGNHASWFNQVPEFAHSYRVITIDQRSFGNSTDTEGLGRSAFVSDLGFLLDHLGIQRAALIGQSMGGGTSVGFACLHPERVWALVLADTLVGIVLPDEIAPFMAEVEKATQNLSQAERVLGPRTRQREPERTLLYLQIASFNSVNVRTVKGQFRRWTPEDIRATGIPTLFVAGADDTLFPPRAIQCVHAQVAGSQYAEIPGSGHSAYFERPRAFNHVVLQFLAAHAC